MGSGEGKGWAKGRTAANDPRIARNADAHRGATYEHRLAANVDKRYAGYGGEGTRTLPLEWSDSMAYVVGLIATDGCLITRGRSHVSFDSGDEQLVRTYLECLGRPMRYRALPTHAGGIRYKAEFSDVRFYRWLETVGLMPRKSLLLGEISVPDEHLLPLLRGLFDGDGYLANFMHRPTARTAPDYWYERLWVFFNSASRRHVEWIQARCDARLGIRGRIEGRPPTTSRHAFFRLKFGNAESVTLLTAMYPRDDVPKLERKWRIWRAYASRRGLIRSVGAPCAEGGI